MRTPHLALLVVLPLIGQLHCPLTGDDGADAGVDSAAASHLDAGQVADTAQVADSALSGGDGAVDATSGNGDCPVVGYAACGGDLVGTWDFRALCPEDPVAAAALCEHPYDDREICTGEGNEAICDSSIEGSLSFHADGTLDVDTRSTMVGTWGFSDACLAAVATAGTTPAERCAGMANAHLSCTYAERCTCVGDPMVETDTNTGTYAVDGDVVTLGEDPPATYCVEGNRLVMDYEVYHPVSWRYWVLERG